MPHSFIFPPQTFKWSDEEEGALTILKAHVTRLTQSTRDKAYIYAKQDSLKAHMTGLNTTLNTHLLLHMISSIKYYDERREAFDEHTKQQLPK